MARRDRGVAQRDRRRRRGQGVLGLERVFSQLGQEDSVIVAIDTLIPRQPDNRILRGVQLRTLRALGREQSVREAFAAWVKAVPGDVAPYKEYAMQLISDTRTALADSVLQGRRGAGWLEAAACRTRTAAGRAGPMGSRCRTLARRDGG